VGFDQDRRKCFIFQCGLTDTLSATVFVSSVMAGEPAASWIPSIPEAVAAAASDNIAITHFIDDLHGRDKGIVFLPGFDCSFIDAMRSSAQIASAYDAQHVLCFSWPSQGEFGLTPYLKDRDSAYASGSAIAQALSTVFGKVLSLGKPSPENLRMVCHSMGNRALSAAVQYISMSMPKLLAETYFKYALLMAADEDKPNPPS